MHKSNKRSKQRETAKSCQEQRCKVLSEKGSHVSAMSQVKITECFEEARPRTKEYVA